MMAHPTKRHQRFYKYPRYLVWLRRLKSSFQPTLPSSQAAVGISTRAETDRV